MAKKQKRLTQREKAERAAIKKQLQADGVLPPNKPRLNRKKFAREAFEAFEAFYTSEPIRAELSLIKAIGFMVGPDMKEVSPEEVGVLILRLVFDGVKTVTKLCPALSYWEGGGRSTMWVTTRVIGAKPFSKGKDATMTKFPILVKTAQKVKHPIIPPIMPLRPYEEMVGWDTIGASYKNALRGQRKYTREAVLYDLFSEVNNVQLWRELTAIKARPDPDQRKKEYIPGSYRHRTITEPKERSLHIPKLRDKIVQTTVHEALQDIYRPVFVDRSYACLYGKGPIRAALDVQHDMRVARMKWGDEAAVIKIDVKKFFYSIDRQVLKRLLAKRFKKLRKKHPERYEDLLRFYRLLCKVIDSSPEGEKGVPLGNVSSQDFANITLNELDQFCIRFLGAKLYRRYADDAVIIAPNKETAREWLAKIKQFVKDKLHLDLNSKTKIFYLRQGVNAYGYKIKATHLELRTQSKRKQKRRVKAMIAKLREGKKTCKEIQQEVNSWLGFARWASAYNLATKIFAPYRFIKVEGELPYGAISRPRQARRILQQRYDTEKAHKALAS